MLEAWRLIGRGQSATLIEISTRSRWILPFPFDPQGILLPRTIILRYYILNHSSPRQRCYLLLMKTQSFPCLDSHHFLAVTVFNWVVLWILFFFFLDQIIDYWLFFSDFDLFEMIKTLYRDYLQNIFRYIRIY